LDGFVDGGQGRCVRRDCGCGTPPGRLSPYFVDNENMNKNWFRHELAKDELRQ
jgi:hypothetical protein